MPRKLRSILDVLPLTGHQLDPDVRGATTILNALQEVSGNENLASEIKGMCPTSSVYYIIASLSNRLYQYQRMSAFPPIIK